MSGGMSLLRAMAGGNPNGDGDGGDRPETPASTLIDMLRNAQARYTSPCPFRAGDLITPRSDSPISGKGRPAIVLEVFDPPILVTEQSLGPTGMEFGARVTMRVLHEAISMNGEKTALIAYCQEHYVYEPYVGPSPSPDAIAN